MVKEIDGFPQPRKMAHSARMKFFVEEEIDQWLHDQMEVAVPRKTNFTNQPRVSGEDHDSPKQLGDSQKDSSSPGQLKAPQEGRGFSYQLRRLREARGLSYRGLQNELNNVGLKVSHTAIRKWELESDKKSLPSKATLSALIKLFNIDLETLLGDDFLAFKPAKKKAGRIGEWQDVELLDEEEYNLLTGLKNKLIQRKSWHP